MVYYLNVCAECDWTMSYYVHVDLQFVRIVMVKPTAMITITVASPKSLSVSVICCCFDRLRISADLAINAYLPWVQRCESAKDHLIFLS